MIYYFVFFPKKRLFFTFFSVFLSLVLLSCAIDDPTDAPRIEVGNNFYYWETNAQSTLSEALSHATEFIKLRDTSTKNLRNVLGKGPHYVWVRTDFKIPPHLRNRPLGLVIPHLTFAEQLYCNEVFISQYGNFPPNEQSTLFKAHFFSFPMNILNQTGKNTILIKIYVQGNSGISTHSFIQPTGSAYASFEVINFRHTRIYIFLTGILLFTSILYMCFYLAIRELKEFRDFAIINFLSSFLLLLAFLSISNKRLTYRVHFWEDKNLFSQKNLEALYFFCFWGLT